MDKPLREHFEVETDLGDSLRTFDYIRELEKYIAYLESKPNGQLHAIMQAEGSDGCEHHFVYARDITMKDGFVCTGCGAYKAASEGASVGNGAAGIGVCVCADLGNTEVNKINDKWICTKCNKPLASSAGSL